MNQAVEGDGTALIAAAGEGYASIVQLLLDRGADINQIVERDENALITASADGHLDVVKLLVSQGADVHARVLVDVFTYDRGVRYVGQEWRSALSVARKENHTAVVQFLQSRRGTRLGLSTFLPFLALGMAAGAPILPLLPFPPV